MEAQFGGPRFVLRLQMSKRPQLSHGRVGRGLFLPPYSLLSSSEQGQTSDPATGWLSKCRPIQTQGCARPWRGGASEGTGDVAGLGCLGTTVASLQDHM